MTDILSRWMEHMMERCSQPGDPCEACIPADGACDTCEHADPADGLYADVTAALEERARLAARVERLEGAVLAYRNAMQDRDEGIDPAPALAGLWAALYDDPTARAAR